jgi:23S rRNA (cytidine1920-2'-O)/16S rRNA (cytidine1409-2'-O)-methyltransferase
VDAASGDALAGSVGAGTAYHDGLRDRHGPVEQARSGIELLFRSGLAMKPEVLHNVGSTMARERLDKLLVERGLAATRERANALVMGGAVLVNGLPAGKPGGLVNRAAEITLKEADHPYVSRGALKLEKGLAAFALDPTGMTCLDIGASTGGFTDLLLRRGATRVYAIDVGYGQLAWSIRQDPRVVVLERENARTMDLTLVPEPCDLAVIDVSFISLTLVLPRIAELLRPPVGKPIIALVKPQFEVGRDLVGSGGVVRDEAVRRSAVEKIRTWATANGFTAGDDVESPITGPAGNVEYLLLLRTAERAAPSAGPGSHDIPPVEGASRRNETVADFIGTTCDEPDECAGVLTGSQKGL